jgi:microcystin-dependent protein
MISLWYGSIGSVPTGWYLCDGTNGTPDLRDRFIVGAGTSYAVGATGGSANHTLTTAEMPAHTHAATSVVTDTGHSHVLQYASGLLGSGSSGGLKQVGTSSTDPAFTGISVATTNASVGSGTSFSILNPYYALAYVMKS